MSSPSIRFQTTPFMGLFFLVKGAKVFLTPRGEKSGISCEPSSQKIFSQILIWQKISFTINDKKVKFGRKYLSAKSFFFEIIILKG